jgi:catalase
VHNHQRDGFHQHAIPVGQANYHPNSLGGACPVIGGTTDVFVHQPERVDGIKQRRRSETFADHYGQATLFWNSMSAWEKEHIVAAYRFELGKVTAPHIRQLMVDHLNRIDYTLALAVSAGIGVPAPAPALPNHGRLSPALSQESRPGFTGIVGRKVAVLLANGVAADSVEAVQHGLAEQVTRTMNTVASVLYDAVIVADGAESVAALVNDGYAVHFVAEAYKHGKPLGILGAGERLVEAARLPVFETSDRIDAPATKPMAGALDGVVILGPDDDPTAFLEGMAAAIALHRHYERPVDGIAA